MVNLDEVKSVAVLGDINSGKTNLVVKFLRDYKGTRQIYLVGYPKQIDDFKKISFFKDLFKLTDSIIFIDEIQRYINIYDRRKIYDLIELISFFAHNNNTLIFSTCLSQFITKAIESYVDCWCMTRIMDLNSLKNGGKPKRIIQDITDNRCNQWSLALKKGEYLEHSELNDSDENGIKTFEFQNIEKDWRVNKENSTENCTINGTINGTSNGTKKVSLKDKLQKNVQKMVQDKSPVETQVSNQGSKPAKKDLTDKEISKLAWNLKK